MTDTHTSETTSPLAKALAIVGFLVTAGLLIWLIISALKLAPSGFASLANTAETINNYRPETELTVTAEKDVVNSGESFQMDWTDMKQAGEYRMTYTCAPGVTIDVRSADGKLIPFLCTDKLNLPATVHGITLSIKSTEMRFTDVPIKIAFTNPEKDTSYESGLKITVVNAAIPVKETTPTVTPKPEVQPETDSEPVTPKPVVTPKPAPVVPQIPTVTYVTPQSNSNGYIDLAVTTVGSGILRNGVFRQTSVYDIDEQNAIRFTVKNIGTKTSESWEFTTQLPDGVTYKSGYQSGLKPQEYITFTLGFGIDNDRDDRVDIKTTVDTRSDTNSKNDRSVWSVRVTD